MTKTPLVHGWAVTFDYGFTDSPIRRSGFRTGDSDEYQTIVGLEARIGARGFARAEIGYVRSDGERPVLSVAGALENLEIRNKAKLGGGTVGAFLAPFFAVGVSGQYRDTEGREVFVNPATGGGILLTRTDGYFWRVAPFALMTAPVGPVRLSLTGVYVRARGNVSQNDGTLVKRDNDRPAVTSRVLEGEASYEATPWLRLGASLAWTDVVTQRTTDNGLPLDEGWATLGANAGLAFTSRLELRLRAAHEIGNARGNALLLGAGLTYRF